MAHRNLGGNGEWLALKTGSLLSLCNWMHTPWDSPIFELTFVKSVLRPWTLCNPAYHQQRLQRERSGAFVPNRCLGTSTSFFFLTFEHQLYRPRNVGLGICVHDVDIDDCVGIALPEMADQEIAVKAIILLLVIGCDSGDLGFLWVNFLLLSSVS
eukprot:1736660-Ditylum_brightwellii.AAC.1